MAILFVFVSDEDLSGTEWATRLDDFARAYYVFKDEAVDVTLASFAGGWPWPSLKRQPREDRPRVARFACDTAAREELADTVSLDQIFVADFEGAYCVGRPAPIWHPAIAACVETVLTQFLASGKPIALVPGMLDLSPHGAGHGLIIIGEAATSAPLAAHALLAAVRARIALRK